MPLWMEVLLNLHKKHMSTYKVNWICIFVLVLYQPSKAEVGLILCYNQMQSMDINVTK